MTYNRGCNLSNTTGVTNGAGTTYTVISEVRVARSLVLCVVFCKSLFVCFIWPLCCRFLFDLRILITPLVSYNSSCMN